jgi:hypothetical protein
LEKTEEGLQRFLKEKADAFWRDKKFPYLLSYIGVDMKADGFDYRSIVGEEGLKAFVRRTQRAGGYRLVEHPSQKAKVGIVPADFSYVFPETAIAESSHEYKQTKVATNEKAVIGFLRALSRLPETDQDAVVIPVRVLTKLLGTR